MVGNINNKELKMKKLQLAIIGAGNIGIAIANGLVESGRFMAEDIRLTRRKVHLLDEMKKRNFKVSTDNISVVKNSKVIIIAVEPQQIDGVLEEIKPELKAGHHIVVSVVTGVYIKQISRKIGKRVTIVRAMPNTAIAVRESMTCMAADRADGSAIEIVKSIFDTVGKTLVIEEEKMVAATALGACGVAFFLRAMRAASQGGIEIGFHAHDALTIASQTARGAATLLLSTGHHPEYEIDRVTTPRGCTIAGLNQMEHEGFSSALIKGIIVSAEKATKLYTRPDSSQE
jgi:pyrroline-5-carboxylate reductase